MALGEISERKSGASIEDAPIPTLQCIDVSVLFGNGREICHASLRSWPRSMFENTYPATNLRISRLDISSVHESKTGSPMSGQ